MEGEIAHSWALEDADRVRHSLGRRERSCAGASTTEDNERYQGPGVGGGLVEEVDWEGNSLWRYVTQRTTTSSSITTSRSCRTGTCSTSPGSTAIARTRSSGAATPAQVGEDQGMWPDAVYEIRAHRRRRARRSSGSGTSWDHVIQDHDRVEARTTASWPATTRARSIINADHRDRPPMTPEQIAERKKELEQEMAELGLRRRGRRRTRRTSGAQTGTAPDWLHTNAIDYHPELRPDRPLDSPR